MDKTKAKKGGAGAAVGLAIGAVLSALGIDLDPDTQVIIGTTLVGAIAGLF